jgi:hypothetical protein
LDSEQPDGQPLPRVKNHAVATIQMNANHNALPQDIAESFAILYYVTRSSWKFALSAIVATADRHNDCSKGVLVTRRCCGNAYQANGCGNCCLVKQTHTRSPTDSFDGLFYIAASLGLSITNGVHWILSVISVRAWLGL